MTIGTRLREARIRNLLTASALAEKAGVHRETIRRAEAGEALSLLTQERLAQALDVPRAELFPENDEAAS